MNVVNLLVTLILKMNANTNIIRNFMTLLWILLIVCL